MPRPLIRALGIVKRAAAEVNLSLKLLDARRANAIVKAAQEVIDGKLDDHFPLVVWQTGSGTQTNMNVNEVIANRANEMLGGKLGAKSPVHPNDHVNMSQSSNDCFPTAMHIAAAEEIALAARSGAGASAGRAAEEEQGSSPGSSRSAARTPRTQRRSRSARNSPATPRRSTAASSATGSRLKQLYPLAQGGTAVGTGLNAHPRFAALFAKKVAAITRLPFVIRAQQVRGAGLARRLRLRARRAERARHRPVQDRQRHPPARLRAALGPRRTDPAGERARLLDHARQGQSDPGRGADHGVLPGVRQPDHDHRRREPGPFRAQRLQARAGAQHAAIDPPAGGRGALVHRQLRSRASAPTRRASAS